MELYDEEIEKTVIGTLISNKDAYSDVAELLNEDCFYVTEHRRLYKCVVEIAKNGLEPDIITVHRRMKDSGHEISLPELIGICNTRSMNLPQMVAILHDLYVKRGLVNLAEEIKAKVNDFQSDPNDIIADISKKTAAFYRNDEGGIHTLTDTLLELTDNINHNAAGMSDVSGTRTGFGKFDEASAGLHKSDLILIAAESSQGKTSLATNIAINAAMTGEGVAIYSMEMTRMQIAARMVASESGLSASQILYKPLFDQQLIVADQAMGKLSRAKIYFDDRSTSNIDSIISSIRYLKKTEGISGAIVDYIQLLSINAQRGTREEQALGEYARRLKNLAKELDIWIIALSQLSRDKLNPVPNDNRLRGSGQLKEAADTVMMIYRPEACDPPVAKYPAPFEHIDTHGTALVKVTKGRNIGLMDFIIGFDASRTKFYDIEESNMPELPPPPVNDIQESIKSRNYNNEQLPF